METSLNPAALRGSHARGRTPETERAFFANEDRSREGMAAEAPSLKLPDLDAVAAPTPAESAIERRRDLAIQRQRQRQRRRRLAAEGSPPQPAPLMAAAEGLPLELSLDAMAPVPATAESAVEQRRRWRRDRIAQRQRQDRRRVAALYAELRAMLPAIPTTTRRVSMEAIVTAAAARVKELEDAAATLESHRAAAPRLGGDMVAVCPATVTVSARLPAAPEPPAGALRRVLEAFERRGGRVLVATMARRGGDGDAVVTVTADAMAPEVVEMIRADIARIN